MDLPPAGWWWPPLPPPASAVTSTTTLSPSHRLHCLAVEPMLTWHALCDLHHRELGCRGVTLAVLHPRVCPRQVWGSRYHPGTLHGLLASLLWWQQGGARERWVAAARVCHLCRSRGRRHRRDLMATNWARWKTCGRNKSRSLWNEEIDIEDISISPGFGCLFQALIEPNIYNTL